jgi:hypothetical protein
MLTHRRITLLLSGTGAVAALAVGGSAVAFNDAPVETEPTPAPSFAPAPIGEIQPDQAAAFRVFRRPQQPSDVMPADVAAAVAGPGRFGRNPGLARAVETATGKGWVVPGRGVVCLVVPRDTEGYATTCNPTSVATDNGLSLQIVAPGESSSSTLVPDGARVVVAQEDDSTDAVRPDASGMAATDTTDAERVTVVTDEGRSTMPVPEPDGTVAPTG